MLYATITGQNPVDLFAVVHATHGQPNIGMTRAEAKRCGEAAWKVYQELNELESKSDK